MFLHSLSEVPINCMLNLLDWSLIPLTFFFYFSIFLLFFLLSGRFSQLYLFLPFELLHSVFIFLIFTSSSKNFFLKICFWMWTIFFKSSLNLLQYCFCFTFWFFGHESCELLGPWLGIKPVPPALEGKVLTAGPLG